MFSDVMNPSREILRSLGGYLHPQPLATIPHEPNRDIRSDAKRCAFLDYDREHPCLFGFMVDRKNLAETPSR